MIRNHPKHGCVFFSSACVHENTQNSKYGQSGTLLEPCDLTIYLKHRLIEQTGATHYATCFFDSMSRVLDNYVMHVWNPIPRKHVSVYSSSNYAMHVLCPSVTLFNQEVI